MAVASEELLWRGEERWIKHYSSGHDILLVGEGDFSFSLCLAMAFGSATNIVATSLDSYEELIKRYKHARVNLARLEMLGATLIHGVDATKMKFSPYLPLQRQKFHRIIFNFPHAGFHHREDHPHLIMKHRNLVHGFFQNASSVLWLDGEIHVTHKIKAPFSRWKIEDLASDCSLLLIGHDEFRITDYPGYNNKRGSGSRSDEPFHIGECRTFRFKLCTSTKKYLRMVKPLEPMHPLPQKFQVPVHDVHRQPPAHHFAFLNGAYIDTRNECKRIFGNYLNQVEQTFGSNSYDVYHSVSEALRHGFLAYKAVGTSEPRPLSCYIAILEELHRLSTLRLEKLTEILFDFDHGH